MAPRTLLASGLVALGCSACLQVAWERHQRYEPIAPETVERLRPGESDLRASLELLGAPLYVWERPHAGAALAWGWFDSDELGFDLSSPVEDNSVSISYDDVDERLRGVVLFFDAAWQLEQVRSGFLSELEPGARRVRPAYEEEDAADDGDG